MIIDRNCYLGRREDFYVCWLIVNILLEFGALFRLLCVSTEGQLAA